MQKNKSRFSDETLQGVTEGDSQHCLRLNDLDEIGDTTHYLDFWMLGLFSFQDWSVLRGIDFWYGFLQSLGIPPDTVTIPPHRPEWRELYSHLPVLVKEDPECVWSDGLIGGDCTEFYIDGVEVGNIVNPLGKSLDCGFGLERLEYFYQKKCGLVLNPPKEQEVLFRTINVLIGEGVRPGNKEQSYVLRKLIRRQIRNGGNLPIHPWVSEEQHKVTQLMNKIPGILRKHPGRTPEFYKDTFGIDSEWLPDS